MIIIMTDTIDPELLAEVRIIREDASDARRQLSRIEESRKQDRRILNRIGLLTVAIVLIGMLNVWSNVTALQTAHDAQQANDALQDCILKTGLCAQKNAALQSQLVLSLSYQTQAQQLKTSIRIAEATGNTAAIPVYQARQQEMADVLQQIRENVIEINAGRPPKHVIPTELPIAADRK